MLKLAVPLFGLMFGVAFVSRPMAPNMAIEAPPELLVEEGPVPVEPEPEVLPEPVEEEPANE